MLTNTKHPGKHLLQKKKRSNKSYGYDLQRQQICDLAARMIHEDGIRDYHKAKQRACESLHFKTKSFLPTNEEVEQAVHRRLELFRPDDLEPSRQLQLSVALDMLNILASYQPRLTGGLVKGIKLKHTPIEIHAFTDASELIRDELQWRGISAFEIEKRYRFANNEYLNVPLIICQLDDHDIEISVFKDKQLHRSPICPTNGKPYYRLSLKQIVEGGDQYPA